MGLVWKMEGGKRCNACGGPSQTLCGGCRQVYYCSPAHQKTDWPYHKSFCLMSRSSPKPLIQENPPQDECVGTYRWTDSDALDALPAFPESVPTLTDWNDYLMQRIPETRSVLPQLIDALSYPISLLYCLQEVGIRLNGSKQNVLVLGASERAEERLSADTNYFYEIADFHPEVERWKLFFVGPEVSTKRHATVRVLGPRMEAEYYRGTTGELLTEHYGEFSAENTFAVGYNTGFGSGYYKLMSSWVADLMTLLSLRLPLFFTCANDYSDLRGEQLLLSEILGPKIVFGPKKNPFSAVSTLHPPGGRETVRVIFRPGPAVLLISMDSWDIEKAPLDQLFEDKIRLD